MKRAGAALLWLLAASIAHAQEQGGQSVVQDGFEVHYAALNAMHIPPATARALGVRRSGNRALLVLNAQRLDGDDRHSVAATASGSARNLLGQDKGLTLRPVQDGGVWYVLADFAIAGGEHIRFDLQVLPEGAERPVPVRFEQMFYRE